MVFSKSSSIPTCHINVNGKLLEQVNSFVYPGSVLYSTDMLCLVNFAIRMGDMDIEPREDEKIGGNRRLVSRKNVVNTLDRQGHHM